LLWKQELFPFPSLCTELKSRLSDYPNLNNDDPENDGDHQQQQQQQHLPQKLAREPASSASRNSGDPRNSSNGIDVSVKYPRNPLHTLDLNPDYPSSVLIPSPKDIGAQESVSKDSSKNKPQATSEFQHSDFSTSKVSDNSKLEEKKFTIPIPDPDTFGPTNKEKDNKASNDSALLVGEGPVEPPMDPKFPTSDLDYLYDVLKEKTEISDVLPSNSGAIRTYASFEEEVPPMQQSPVMDDEKSDVSCATSTQQLAAELPKTKKPINYKDDDPKQHEISDIATNTCPSEEQQQKLEEKRRDQRKLELYYRKQRILERFKQLVLEEQKAQEAKMRIEEERAQEENKRIERERAQDENKRIEQERAQEATKRTEELMTQEENKKTKHQTVQEENKRTVSMQANLYIHETSSTSTISKTNREVVATDNFGSENEKRSAGDRRATICVPTDPHNLLVEETIKSHENGRAHDDQYRNGSNGAASSCNGATNRGHDHDSSFSETKEILEYSGPRGTPLPQPNPEPQSTYEQTPRPIPPPPNAFEQPTPRYGEVQNTWTNPAACSSFGGKGSPSPTSSSQTQVATDAGTIESEEVGERSMKSVTTTSSTRTKSTSSGTDGCNHCSHLQAHHPFLIDPSAWAYMPPHTPLAPPHMMNNSYRSPRVSESIDNTIPPEPAPAPAEEAITWSEEPILKVKEDVRRLTFEDLNDVRALRDRQQTKAAPSLVFSEGERTKALLEDIRQAKSKIQGNYERLASEKTRTWKTYNRNYDRLMKERSRSGRHQDHRTSQQTSHRHNANNNPPAATNAAPSMPSSLSRNRRTVSSSQTPSSSRPSSSYSSRSSSSSFNGAGRGSAGDYEDYEAQKYKRYYKAAFSYQEKEQPKRQPYQQLVSTARLKEEERKQAEARARAEAEIEGELAMERLKKQAELEIQRQEELEQRETEAAGRRQKRGVSLKNAISKLIHWRKPSERRPKSNFDYDFGEHG
jgi:hypothetical protein